jgi:hypothetical protein
VPIGSTDAAQELEVEDVSEFDYQEGAAEAKELLKEVLKVLTMLKVLKVLKENSDLILRALIGEKATKPKAPGLITMKKGPELKALSLAKTR